jgi:hypothetical protein
MAGSWKVKEADAVWWIRFAPAGWRARGIGRLLLRQAVIAAGEGQALDHGG